MLRDGRTKAPAARSSGHYKRGIERRCAAGGGHQRWRGGRMSWARGACWRARARGTVPRSSDLRFEHRFVSAALENERVVRLVHEFDRSLVGQLRRAWGGSRAWRAGVAWHSTRVKAGSHLTGVLGSESHVGLAPGGTEGGTNAAALGMGLGHLHHQPPRWRARQRMRRNAASAAGASLRAKML